ncbi:PREDICTED: protein unc-13 homolog 4B-like isoform X2 [Bactrocera latifrons]|uniref:protein unc-13 homolog 4B-like isoform X2 n=1 Tax=Bactrocera latifrons TaxID=174628 RepID=UPI0008DC7633|nr:PREDICTED: protein unc-13 homolog 4B-like isoform X2 [Bactrocera latifrons]
MKFNMDEERMWKSMLAKLQELKVNPPTEHESRLQETDGGFFEKFGSLLKQKSHLEETEMKTNLEPFAVDYEVDDEKKDIKKECIKNSSSIGSEESVNTHELKNCKEELVESAIGMNIFI